MCDVQCDGTHRRYVGLGVPVLLPAQRLDASVETTICQLANKIISHDVAVKPLIQLAAASMLLAWVASDAVAALALASAAHAAALAASVAHVVWDACAAPVALVA